MDYVEVVVKIPKGAYELLQTTGVDWLGAEHILDAVSKGTLLPEGHGRLIDKDEIIGKIHGVRSITAVLDAPTIIEADEAETEE